MFTGGERIHMHGTAGSLKVWAGISVQGPRPPASQQDILTFSNNLHFKIKYRHRCLWLVISDLTCRRAQGSLGRINMNKSLFQESVLPSPIFITQKFLIVLRSLWDLSIFRAFQSSNLLLLLFLLLCFLSIIYLFFVSDTSSRKTWASAILSNQAFSFPPHIHKHPI